MASIPLPVATATDQVSMRVEEELEIILGFCQSASQSSDASGKNAVMKANMQLMQTAVAAWSTALTTQIATL